jgi:hypothetical protein
MDLGFQNVDRCPESFPWVSLEPGRITNAIRYGWCVPAFYDGQGTPSHSISSECLCGCPQDTKSHRRWDLFQLPATPSSQLLEISCLTTGCPEYRNQTGVPITLLLVPFSGRHFVTCHLHSACWPFEECRGVSNMPQVTGPVEADVVKFTWSPCVPPLLVLKPQSPWKWAVHQVFSAA